MRSLVNTVLAAVGVFLLSGVPGEAQEATPIQQSSELKVLQQFIGSWEQQVVSKPAEWTPEKTTMTRNFSKTTWYWSFLKRRFFALT